MAVVIPTQGTFSCRNPNHARLDQRKESQVIGRECIDCMQILRLWEAYNAFQIKLAGALQHQLKVEDSSQCPN